MKKTIATFSLDEEIFLKFKGKCAIENKRFSQKLQELMEEWLNSDKSIDERLNEKERG